MCRQVVRVLKLVRTKTGWRRLGRAVIRLLRVLPLRASRIWVQMDFLGIWCRVL